MTIKIVDFPINRMVIFHSYVNVYQRVTILKNISQWEGLSHILWKIKNV